MAAEGQSDRMTSVMEVWVKKRCVTVFLHAEKMAVIDIHQCFLNIYGDQTVDVSTVRWWVVHFSSGDNDVGSPLLVQVLMSAACEVLFINGENAQLMVVTAEK